MRYLTLPTSLIQKMLEGERDELAAANQARVELIKSCACPRCGSSLHPKLNTQNPFGAEALPRLNSTCPQCGYEVTDGGIVVSTGKASRVDDPLPIVDPSSDS